MRWRAATVGTLALCWAVAPAGGVTATGTLDTTFNGTGKVPIASPWTTSRMLATANNALYVALEANVNGTYPVRVQRYTSAGALDPTFGSGGQVDVDLATGGRSVPTALVPDGTGLLVAMFNTANDSFGIDRLTSAGVLDATFSGDGRVVMTPPAGSAATIADAFALPDGRIELAVIASQFASPYPGTLSLVRLHSNGTPDTTLGPNGTKVVASFAADFGATQRPDAHFTSAGDFYDTLPTAAGHTKLQLRKPNGALDTSFNGTGSRRFGCGSGTTTFSGPSLLVDAADRPLLECETNPTYNLDFWRFTTTGAADSTFATSGHLHVGIHASYPYDITFGTDGSSRVVVAYIDFPGSPTRLHVWRYTATGAPDPAFATTGKGTISFRPQYDMNTTAMTFGPNRIYLSLYPFSAPSEIDIAVTA